MWFSPVESVAGVSGGADLDFNVDHFYVLTGPVGSMRECEVGSEREGSNAWLRKVVRNGFLGDEPLILTASMC